MRRRAQDQQGVVLVLVLLILTLVVAMALSLGREVRIEIAVAREHADQVKLRAMTASAIEQAMAAVRLDTDPGDSLFSTWRDDEALFAGTEHAHGRTWLLLTEPDPGDGHEVRYGVRDEASKLDINVATKDQLLAVPGITDEAVDGILDWRDDDDDAEELGAETIVYAALDPPYEAKNAPFESLDELLRVNGIDASMLYGEDRNRNGVLDPGEDDGDGSFPPDDADGELDRGLIDYLTVYSRDLNRTNDNRMRLVYSEESANALDKRLSEAGLSGPLVQRIRLLKTTNPEIESLGELVMRMGSSDPEQVAILLDQVSAAEAEMLPGLINVNTAPRELLTGLGLEDEELVEQILTRRTDPSADLSSPAWLLNVIPLQRFAQLVDRITTRSIQFTVHAVALLDDRPRFRRVEVLIDRGFVPVRLLLIRDVTSLGFPLTGERGDDLP
jgi:type II secretory pathway component PulK